MGVSWFGGGAVSSSRPADARAARAAAVKDGRRPPPQAARSVLDGGEHDATLKAARAKNQPMALFRLTPKGERSLNREPAVPPNPTHFTPTNTTAMLRHAMPQAPRCIRPPDHPPPAPPPPDHQISAARPARRPHPPRQQNASARRNACAQRTARSVPPHRPPLPRHASPVTPRPSRLDCRAQPCATTPGAQRTGRCSPPQQPATATTRQCLVDRASRESPPPPTHICPPQRRTP